MLKIPNKNHNDSATAVIQKNGIGHNIIGRHNQTKAMLKKRNSDLLILQEITKVASKSLDLDEIYNLVMDKLQNIMGIKICGIQLFDESCEWLYLKAHRGISKKYSKVIEKIKVADDAMAQHILSTGQPKIVIDRKKQDEPRKKEADKEKLGSFVIVPLCTANQILGELVIQNHGTQKFFIKDINVWASIGETIGMAIKNARLYDSVKHELLERKKAEKEIEKNNIQLKRKIKDLEKIHTFVVDREMKMIELKKHIKELKESKKK